MQRWRASTASKAKSLLWQQSPAGIDAGAFHSDVLAVGNEDLLVLHEQRSSTTKLLLSELRARLGPGFTAIVASEAELPAAEAVRAYPFNSQLLTLPSGKMTILAPRETERAPSARAFLERVVEQAPAVESLHYIDVNASMKNGGGPACLRLRVVLEDEERAAIRARVFFDDALGAELESWVRRHYRDRLTQERSGRSRPLGRISALARRAHDLVEARIDLRVSALRDLRAEHARRKSEKHRAPHAVGVAQPSETTRSISAASVSPRPPRSST